MSIRKLVKKILSKMKVVEPFPIPVLETQLLKGKIALIAGGSGGIGFAIAESFVKSGCFVVLLGTKKEKLEECCEKLGNDVAKYIVSDLSNVSEHQSIVKRAATFFDDKGRIDILVNSAGLHTKQVFGEVEEKTWDSIIDINLKSVYFMSQYVSQYMKDKSIKGNILNISSASALKPGWTPYEISKAGVESLTRGLADELVQYGIVVNAIGPGPVATPMLNREGNDLSVNNLVGRMAAPEEIGQWATYMVSDMGQLVIGDTIYISGGSGVIKLR